MSNQRPNWALIGRLGCIGVKLLSGQTAGTGALTGAVTDPAGAVVPNVAVTVTNTGSGLARSATSGTDGNYTVSLLPPGMYKVRFSASGFKTAEVGPVAISVTRGY